MTRNEWTFIGVILVLSLVVGCGGGGGGGAVNPAAPQQSADYVDFGGLVSYNGAPMSGAAVYLITPAQALESGLKQTSSGITAGIRADSGTGNSFASYATQSDTAGRFQFNRVAAGIYSLVAVKDGRQAIRTGLDVNAAITTVDVALTPTGNLTGTITIPGTTDQTAILVFLEGTSYVAFTGPTGTFSLFNVPAGTYNLRAQRGTYGMTAAVSVTVVPAQDVTVAPVQLVSAAGSAATGSLSGRATKIGQTIHSGIIAHLQGTQFVAITDTAGGYTFNAVSPGSYTLTHVAEGYLSPTPQIVTVSLGANTTAAAVSLSPGSTGTSGGLIGRVVKVATIDEGETHQIPLRISSGTFERITVANADGSFAFSQVPLGSYLFESLDSDYALASGPSVVLEATNPFTTYGPFNLVPVLSGTSRVLGSITPFSDGSFLAGDVFLFRQGVSGPVEISSLGPNGGFIFRNLEAGNYLIRLDPQTGYKFNIPAGFFALGNSDRVVRTGLPILPLDKGLSAYGTFTAPSGAQHVGVVAGADVDAAFQVVLEHGSTEYHLPTPGTKPPWATAVGDLSGVPPGVYQLYLENEEYGVESAVASTPFTLRPPSVAATSIQVTVSLDQVNVSWEGVPNAASYSLNLYVNGAGTTPALTISNIYATSYTHTIVNPVTNFQIGVVSHANGVSSLESRTSSWITSQNRIANVTAVQYTNSLVSTPRDAYAYNGYVYFFWNQIIGSNYNESVTKIDCNTGGSTGSVQYVSDPNASPFLRGYVSPSFGVYAAVDTSAADTTLYRADLNLGGFSNQTVAGLNLTANPFMTHNPANGDVYAVVKEGTTNFYLLKGDRVLSAALTSNLVENIAGSPSIQGMTYSPNSSLPGTFITIFDGVKTLLSRYADNGTRLSTTNLTTTGGMLQGINQNLLVTVASRIITVNSSTLLGIALFQAATPSNITDAAVDGRGRIWIYVNNGTGVDGEVFIYSSAGALLDFRTVAASGSGAATGLKCISYDSALNRVVLFYKTNAGTPTFNLYSFDASF